MANLNPFIGYNPFIDGLDGRGPGSELDHPGGPPTSYAGSEYGSSASSDTVLPTYVAPPRHAPPPHVVLPPFRPSRPAAWIGQVENIFRMRGVVDQRDQFGYAIAMLGDDDSLAIDDLLEIFPPPPDAFTRLKQRLLATHALTTYERVEQLLEMQPLGGQRPSVLLAHMKRLVPPGEEKGVLFRCLFLKHLPREIRLALAEDHFSPVEALAARADKLVVHHDSNVVAVATVEDPVVAPVTAGGRPAQPRGRPSGGSGNASGGNSVAGSNPSKKGGGKKDRRKRVGVCYSHYRYGDDAWQCDQPGNCSFKSEN
jgi:hypothetical protein